MTATARPAPRYRFERDTRYLVTVVDDDGGRRDHRLDAYQGWLAGPEGWDMTVCTIDLRVGGAYRYEWFKEKTGERMGMGGEYREIVPNERLVATEKFDMAWYPGGAVVTTLLTEADGITTLQSTVTYDTAEARESVLRSPMETGVEASYSRLEKLLETNFA